jgi:hypothetical protein
MGLRRLWSLGCTDRFETKLEIPSDFRGYAAIGNIFSQAYYLALVAQVGCCYSNSMLFHTVVVSPLEPEERERPLDEWMRAVVQPKVFADLPRYSYQSSERIQESNQGGQSGILREMQERSDDPREGPKDMWRDLKVRLLNGHDHHLYRH